MQTHPWQFFRAGGVDQVQLRTGADLLALEHLDQKLWLALACPVSGVEFDRRTLELIDADGDQRVRASELIAAIKWAASSLTDVEQLARGADSLPLSLIAEESPEGEPLRAAALEMLATLGKEDATEISVQDTMDATEAFDEQTWNGDGVVPETSLIDDADKALIAEIVAATEEPDVDRNGEPGVSQESIEAFFTALEEYLAWLDAGKTDEIMVLGEDTAEAAAAFEAIKPKIDDFFARTRIAAFDPRALESVNREQSDYLEILAKDLCIDADELEGFPLAQVSADAPLPLNKGVNPAWAGRMVNFVQHVLNPLFGDIDTLSNVQWAEVSQKFAAYQEWYAARAGEQVAEIEEPRLREIAAGDGRERLEALVERDLDEKPKADAIAKVEKLVRLSRDLMDLGNNFVAFRHFYSRQKMSIFQVGTLYIDQRSCDLCIDVTDVGRHGDMAPHSNGYLLYCDLKNAAGDTRSIAALMSNGDQDNIMVGRNGIFYDRDGNDWDATVTKIVENPISIRQAFWAPYKKAIRMIEQQISKRAEAAEARADERLAGGVDQAGAAADGDAPPPPPEESKKLDIGVLAAIGVGVSGAVAAAGLLLEAFFGLGIWMPVGVLGLVLLISGPSMLIAWLKLRQRNLAPLLDANGWAVNARAKINIPLGRSLTQLAVLPEGASRDVNDPFAEKKRPWPVYLLIILLILGAGGWYLGFLDNYLPVSARSVSVLGENAPAAIQQEREEQAKAAEEAEEEAAEEGDEPEEPAEE